MIKKKISKKNKPVVKKPLTKKVKIIEPKIKEKIIEPEVIKQVDIPVKKKNLFQRISNLWIEINKFGNIK
jgi:hypothetical protein